MADAIGNYKGVMLCNRPNEPVSKPERQGPAPFISRVTPPEPLGINPAAQVAKVNAPNKRNFEILKRHRQWLSDLQKHKEEQQKLVVLEEEKKQKKVKRISQKAAKKRGMVRDEERSVKTAGGQSRGKPQSRPKPKWAMTNQEAAEVEEKEVDELLNFAYDLDFEQFINDLEIQNAIKLIQERVDEIENKRDRDWKESIVKKFNEDEDQKSVAASEGSQRSQARSVKSMRSSQKPDPDQIRQTDAESEAGWDKSVKGTKAAATAEERIAKMFADQVMQDNPRFKNVHSNASIRALLEQEAKRYLEQNIRKPVITVINEGERKRMPDASNLPYLHRNPAVQVSPCAQFQNGRGGAFVRKLPDP